MELSDKSGLPPGTITYAGEKRTEKAQITLIQYNETDFFEQQFDDIVECFQYTKPDMVSWINVDGIHDVDLVERVGKHFNIHPLTLEDVVNTHQRPKFEDYENYVVSIMKMLSYHEEIETELLSILLMDDNTVVSFQEVHGGDAFDLIRNRLRAGKGRIRKCHADYLAYCLIDAVVDFYFTILEKIGDKIEEVEEEVIDQPSVKTVKKIHHLKRQMIYLRKAVWPLRELITNFERSESKLISQPTMIYLRDVHDHAIRVIDTVETYRDLLSGMMDIYLSSISNRMNEVMKVLTIITTLFVPVTFIAGVYGMNFEFMPELHTKYGYFAAWGVMLGIIFSLLIYFRRKKWI